MRVILPVFLLLLLSFPAAQAQDDATPVTAEAEASSDQAEEDTEFGAYRIHVGMARPTFGTALKYYNKLYGAPRFYPYFGVDHLFLRDRFSLGLGFRLGVYRANGHTVKTPTVDNPEPSELVKEADETSLVLLPLSFLVSSQFDVTGSKFLLLDAWVGYQDLYYQESRSDAVAGATGVDAGKVATSSGWNGNLVMGGSLNVNISKLDQSSIRSLRFIGLRSVYIALFFELVSKLGSMSILGKAGKTNFSRINLGIGFVFESL